MQAKVYTSKTDQRHLREAAQLAGTLCEQLINTLEPGMTTLAIDSEATRLLQQHRSLAPFRQFEGFGHACCVSVNDGIVNGKPSDDVIIQAGDVVSIAIGTCIGRMHGKAARTAYVGADSDRPEDVSRLLQGTMAVFERIQQTSGAFNTIASLAQLIETCAAEFGLQLIERSSGQGIGYCLHEPPEYPNTLADITTDQPIPVGHAFTLMPMMTLGPTGPWTVDSQDGWTHRTSDGALAAHEADTLLMTPDGPINLSRV
jgi:methionyl aminopeptidase